ncbi:hypothetical protein CEXT_163321 [Caerostris extrusa]|uniref:Uncharacterized protein n=1 Tax=Caerostris extrusa TaxID=172846 RepID=A0AAV4SX49_CAEEX|nr:hypothetical protein CEXT_163321 [Caerostris extrusa]
MYAELRLTTLHLFQLKKKTPYLDIIPKPIHTAGPHARTSSKTSYTEVTRVLDQLARKTLLALIPDYRKIYLKGGTYYELIVLGVHSTTCPGELYFIKLRQRLRWR